jgi:cytochrome c
MRERMNLIMIMKYVCAAAVSLALNAVAANAADVEHGKELFKACAACHNDQPGALGPTLNGVVGRKAAVLDTFRYSGPMLRANLVWTPENLHDYIADPQAKVKGNRMPYGGLTNASDVDDLVAYLATLK